MTGELLNQYISETWERPSGCVARNVDGNPLVHGVDENVLPLSPDAPCLEAPMMGLQFGPMAADGGFGASVDGNYGFGDGCFATGFNAETGTCNNSPWTVTFNAFGNQPQITVDILPGTSTVTEGDDVTYEVQSLPFTTDSFTLTFDGQTTSTITGPATAEDIQTALNALSNIGDGVVVTEGTAVDPIALLSNMDYLVKVEIPNDTLGRPMYKVTREEDINIANGDSFIPQVPPPVCAGLLHTVDVADSGIDRWLPGGGWGRQCCTSRSYCSSLYPYR